MKVACANNEDNISKHFGYCKYFTIYEVENGTIFKEGFKANPGHKPGLLPVFLGDLEVDVIIAGGMGETAQQLFKENKIKVIVGVDGTCKNVIEKYIQGDLKSTGKVCREHEHEDFCNK
ncbi:NifB/NifX family molybdenum-iron cluster-binding protein [Clostridium botulinum]|nr:NifB/NifX family molybdenum-iron cluster-binding protein [Clostridium botulinum]